MRLDRIHFSEFLDTCAEEKDTGSILTHGLPCRDSEVFSRGYEVAVVRTDPRIRAASITCTLIAHVWVGNHMVPILNRHRPFEGVQYVLRLLQNPSDS